MKSTWLGRHDVDLQSITESTFESLKTIKKSPFNSLTANI